MVHRKGKWSLPLGGRSCHATLKGCGYIGGQILIINLPAQSFLKLNTGSLQYAFSMMPWDLSVTGYKGRTMGKLTKPLGWSPRDG